MFTPTKKSLEELGFKQWNFWNYEYQWLHFKVKIEITQSWSKFTQVSLNYMWHQIHQSEFYPQSIEDIQTLIRLLSPNN